MQRILIIPIKHWDQPISVPRDGKIISFKGDSIGVLTQSATDHDMIGLLPILVDMSTSQTVPDGFKFALSDTNYALFIKTFNL